MVAQNDKVDGGLADAAYDADQQADVGPLEKGTPVPDAWVDDNSDHSVVEAMETLLFHEHLSAEQKVLLMILVWKGEPLTKDDIAKAAGLTSRTVEYAMRLLVKLGLVSVAEQPDPRVKKWVNVYSLDLSNVTPKALADLKPPAKGPGDKAGD